jgi:hypothetical protein
MVWHSAVVLAWFSSRQREVAGACMAARGSPQLVCVSPWWCCGAPWGPCVLVLHRYGLATLSCAASFDTGH